MAMSLKVSSLESGQNHSLTITIAVLYATVSASFIIEQEGLPLLTTTLGSDGQKIELWNDESPKRRLDKLLLDTRSG